MKHGRKVMSLGISDFNKVAVETSEIKAELMPLSVRSQMYIA